MGVCVSVCIDKDVKLQRFMDNLPPEYANDSPRTVPIKVEHRLYDYVEHDYQQEKLGFICMAHVVGFHADRIAIVDLDEDNETYCKVISSVSLSEHGEEPGRINWTRSAPHLEDIGNILRSHLVVPCMNSNRIYIIGVEGKKLTVTKVIESEELERRDMSCPYAVHAMPIKGAPVHVSVMGDKEGHAKGDFLLLDRNTFDIRTKQKKEVFSGYGGDFALQTRQNVLLACEWGHPKRFRDGLTDSDLENVSSSYGTSVHVWQISPGLLKQTIDLGETYGRLTTAIRFLHNSDNNHAFVCAALGSSVFHLYMNSLNGEWSSQRVVTKDTFKVDNWMANELPALLTDCVISLDDRWLYVCGWLHGIVWQYDITDPFNISLVAKIHLGGILRSDPDIQLLEEETYKAYRQPLTHERAQNFRGGPAMLQLSLDGQRLYVTNSFYKPWDAQFYPQLVKDGGQIMRILVNSVSRQMTIDDKFCIDLKGTENGPFVARDLRFATGDSTNDCFQ